MSELEQSAPEGNVYKGRDLDAMAAEVKAMTQGEANAEAAIESLNEQIADPTVDVDVPNTFWDNMEKPEAEPEAEVAQEEPEATEEVEAEPEVAEEPKEDVPADQIIRFKANGEEVEMTLEEAKKQLSMAQGAQKAFNKLDRANKKVKELEAKQQELAEKAALLDKLEEVKHDWKAVLQIATGQDPEQFLAEVMRKQTIRETGTEAERAQLEKEERLAQLERQLEAQRQKQEQLEKLDQERAYGAEKAELKSMLESEFFKNQFKLEDQEDTDYINETLWQRGQKRMQQYVKKYQDHPKFKTLLPKIVQKSFEEEAQRLKRVTTGSVQAKVEEAIKNKKQKAAEQAAVASTRQLKQPDADKFKNAKSVREIAEALTGSKKFSLW